MNTCCDGAETSGEKHTMCSRTSKHTRGQSPVNVMAQPLIMEATRALFESKRFVNLTVQLKFDPCIADVERPSPSTGVHSLSHPVAV